MNLQESIDRIKQVMGVINEDTMKSPSINTCTAIIGYLDMYGSQIVEDAKDKIKMLQAKKEVMIYCENIRDKKSPIKFSQPESIALYNTVFKLILGKDLTQFIQKGKGIKHY
jgi:hypothetical protein